jgi:hypothetical protein
MNKKIIISVLLILCTLTETSHGFSLWKTCFDFDESTKKKNIIKIFHKIIDADVMKVWNQSHSSLAIVKCFAGRGRHAFSRFEDGEPLYPNSSVRIPSKNGEICEGDTVYVYGEECHIISLTKGKPLE